ncbi:MAG: hypothetical protein M9931_10765 [Chitinophagales bacterium]|nr:hypothetical protein [Chitinophagales bacterium]
MLKHLLLITAISSITFSYSQSGRVGIGTSNPEQKLDVAGSAKANDKVIGTRGFVAGSVTTDTATAVFSTDIKDKGFYIPRLTTSEKTTLGNSLNSGNKGLLVFDTDLNRTDFWNGTAWKAVGDGVASPITADNGLNINTGSNVRLGGSLIASTEVDVSNNTLKFTNTGGANGTGIGISTTASGATPDANTLVTINPNNNTFRNGIGINMSGMTSKGNGINIGSGSSNARGFFYSNTSGSNGVFWGIGSELSTTNIVSGYNAYRNGSGLSYGLFGITGTNSAYTNNANTWALFSQGRAVISGESSPTSTLGTDLEVRNTTSGSNPVTVSLRQTTQNQNIGDVLANINIGDNNSNNPQAQIKTLREAASSSTSDVPTAITFSTTKDGTNTLTERMRISNDGSVKVANLSNGVVKATSANGTLSSGQVNLASEVTGTLPVGNLPNLAGDVTGALNSNTIATNAVTTSKIANNAVTIAKLPTGATNTTFLRGDGTWVTPIDNNTTYTASNGLNINSNDVRLGGTLSTNTDVALNSKNISFSGSGNIGIGNNSPYYKLHVTRDAGQSSVSEFYMGDGTQSLHFNSNLGPGHYNPLVSAGDHGMIFSNGTQNSGNLVIGPWSNTAAGIKVMADGRVGIGTGSPAGKLQVMGSSMVYSTKTDAIEPNYATGDQTVLLGLYTAGSSVKFEFYATGGWAEKGAEFNVAGEWSNQPSITVISDPSGLIGGRLKLYFKPNGSPSYGSFWLAATWENVSPSKSSANALRFRVTSAADFDVSNTTSFSGYTQLNRNVENGPIGSIMAWHKDLPGVPGLPSNWVECNGQTLSDAASPLNGQVIPNLNGNNYFLRGNTASGSIGGAASHTHGINIQQVGWDAAPDASHYTDGTIISTAAASNLPPYMDIVWIMRVK